MQLRIDGAEVPHCADPAAPPATPPEPVDCDVCRRKLRDPASIARRRGPVCHAKATAADVATRADDPALFDMEVRA